MNGSEVWQIFKIRTVFLPGRRTFNTSKYMNFEAATFYNFIIISEELRLTFFALKPLSLVKGTNALSKYQRPPIASIS